MSGRVKGFTPAERTYLESLPAVDAVDAVNGRIYYAQGFRRHVMAEYRRGASPTALFREAGLDPRLIGHKRIERSIARWRGDDDPVDERASLDESASVDGYSVGQPDLALVVLLAARVDRLEASVHALRASVEGKAA